MDPGNLPEVICIVVGWIRYLGIAQRYYELYTSPVNRRELSPKEAKAIIDERGLVKALEDRDGCVYDSPDGAFLRKYQGWYRTHK